jgi:hypothetical protein
MALASHSTQYKALTTTESGWTGRCKGSRERRSIGVGTGCAGKMNDGARGRVCGRWPAASGGLCPVVPQWRSGALDG